MSGRRTIFIVCSRFRRHREKKLMSSTALKFLVFVTYAAAVFVPPAYGQRMPLKPDATLETKRLKHIQEVKPYVIPQPGTPEAQANPYADPKAPPVITYDKTTGKYTYWFNTRYGGKRLSSVIGLTDYLRLTITARVEANADRSEFTYVYTITNLPDSDQPLDILFLKVDPAAVDEIVTDEGWEYSTPGAIPIPDEFVGKLPPRPKHISISKRLTGTIADLKLLGAGESMTVKLKSRLGPRFVTVEARGLTTRGIFPSDDAPDELYAALPVFGPTLGPADTPLGAPLDALRETITTAGTWGWISKAMEKDILDRIDHFPASGKTLREFLNEIDTTAGRTAPAVHAMIDEILHNL